MGGQNCGATVGKGSSQKAVCDEATDKECLPKASCKPGNLICICPAPYCALGASCIEMTLLPSVRKENEVSKQDIEKESNAMKSVLGKPTDELLKTQIRNVVAAKVNDAGTPA